MKYTCQPLGIGHFFSMTSCAFPCPLSFSLSLSLSVWRHCSALPPPARHLPWAHLTAEGADACRAKLELPDPPPRRHLLVWRCWAPGCRSSGLPPPAEGAWVRWVPQQVSLEDNNFTLFFYRMSSVLIQESWITIYLNRNMWILESSMASWLVLYDVAPVNMKYSRMYLPINMNV